jgi:hypothetical protein
MGLHDNRSDGMRRLGKDCVHERGLKISIGASEERLTSSVTKSQPVSPGGNARPPFARVAICRRMQVVRFRSSAVC